MQPQQQIQDWVIGGGAALILSAAARSLREPKEASSEFYWWFYKFVHLLLVNWDKSSMEKPK